VISRFRDARDARRGKFLQPVPLCNDTMTLTFIGPFAYHPTSILAFYAGRTFSRARVIEKLSSPQRRHAFAFALTYNISRTKEGIAASPLFILGRRAHRKNDERWESAGIKRKNENPRERMRAEKERENEKEKERERENEREAGAKH